MNHKKILILAANPTNTKRLRLDKELKEINDSLRRSKLRDYYTLEQHLAVSLWDWRRALLDLNPHIVHFCGHGQGEGGLALVNESTGKAQLLSTDAIAGLFEVCPQLECVVLNACYSEVQAQAIQKWIPTVIGMNQAIGDKTALEFSVGFYDGLFSGLTYGDAFKVGRNAIQAKNIPEHHTPVLLGASATQPISLWSRVLSRGKSFLQQGKSVLVASVLVSLGVMGLRILGVWQFLELQHYDVMLNTNVNAQGLDSRLFIIEITEEDYQKHYAEGEDRQGDSVFLPDNYLQAILDKLESDPENRPKVVGLDVLRPTTSANQELATLLQQTDNLITICAFSNQDNSNGIGAVPEVRNSSSAQARISFSDVDQDSDNNKVRRFMMFVKTPEGDCPTTESFALKLATHYLQPEKSYIPPDQSSSDHPLQLGDVIFAKLGFSSGGYQRAMSAIPALPYEVLLNFRNTGESGNIKQIAESISVDDFLNTNIDPNLIKDKIVLIGATNEADTFNTPFGEIPGVVLHAHFVSYVLDVVEGKRSQIHWWPIQYDFMFALGWAMVGGLTIAILKTPQKVIAAVAILLLGMTMFSLVVFWWYSLWLPFVPAVLGFGITGTITLIKREN